MDDESGVVDELDPIFMQFHRQTMAHQRARKAAKAAAAKREAAQEARGASAKVRQRERLAEAKRRQQELQALYGGSVGEIIQLEAKLNMRHDHSIDTHAPALWPALPLNL
jgi:cell fate (sporulation/competence/biofilm development) regulator YlbF (YheA/YmcA/DUF963 family)